MYSFQKYFENTLDTEDFFWEKNKAEVEAMLIESDNCKVAIHRDYENQFYDYISMYGHTNLFCFAMIERNMKIFYDQGRGAPIGRYTMVLHCIVQARYSGWGMPTSRLFMARVSMLKVLGKAWGKELLFSPVEVLLNMFFHRIDRELVDCWSLLYRLPPSLFDTSRRVVAKNKMEDFLKLPSYFRMIFYNDY